MSPVRKLFLAFAAFFIGATTLLSQAQARVEAGMLTCEVGGGFALILSSPRDLHCVFHKANGQTEAYGGRLREVGLDVGVSGRGVIAWEVVAGTTDLPPGELSGRYGGVEAGAAVGLGGSARAMVGGSNRTISLQPLSVEGRSGINIAVGVASMELLPLFKASPATAYVQVPSVGIKHEAVPHARKVPHYGCGSYTHLQRGQTLSGLAHACGVTLEALLDENPQIDNVRDISAGALVNIPSHVGHHAASPCGDRTILQDGEALDHLAWRCGVTMHALLLANPAVRDMAMVRPGLVMTIPARSAAPAGPPVRYAAQEEHAGAHAAIMRRPLSTGAFQQRFDTSRQMNLLREQEQACIGELADTLGVPVNAVRMTARDLGHNNHSLIYLDADGQRISCEVDDALQISGLTRLDSLLRASISPGSGGRQQPLGGTGGSDVSGAAINACRSAVSRETGDGNLSVLNTEFSEANSLVMIGVGQNRAPWRCLVSNDGQVQEVMFTGDDSAGVPDTSGGMGGSDVSGAAINACMAAVTDQTGEGNISVSSTEFSEANSLVMIGVGADRAPWRCLVSNDGQVQEVMFTGDDSAGGTEVAAADSDAYPNYERPVGGVLPDGSSFDASGQMPCVRDRDAADAMCDFGVVREGSGNGWMQVFWPDGGARTIRFENGSPSGFDRAEADGDAEMSVTQNGDSFVVFVGEARFEFPEAVITGG